MSQLEESLAKGFLLNLMKDIKAGRELALMVLIDMMREAEANREIVKKLLEAYIETVRREEQKKAIVKPIRLKKEFKVIRYNLQTDTEEYVEERINKLIDEGYDIHEIVPAEKDVVFVFYKYKGWEGGGGDR